MKCPHCGHVLPEDDDRKALVLANASMSYQQLEILKLLVNNVTVTKERMFFALWGAMGEPEPETARSVVAVRLNQIKNLLKPQGWTIRTVKHGGGRGGGTTSIYALERAT